MKKHIRYILLLLVLIAGCKKYEDGPLLSLRTKYARIIGKWEFEYYEVNGTDSTSYLRSIYPVPEYTFARKREGEQKAFGADRIGYWSFEDRHESIGVRLETSIVSPIVGPYGLNEVKWKILYLTNKALWLKSNYNQKTYVSHLKKTEEK